MSDQISGGVYSNQDILAAIERGHIVCHPFNRRNVSGSSLDITLGHYYYRTEYNTANSLYNPFDPEEVSRYFGQVQQAIIHKDWARAARYKLLTNIPSQHPIIILKPGERILAHSHEFVGIKPPGTSTMQARSTWGRNGLAVCLDAGWGDPGFINRWTMEIYNMNQYHSIVLPVGERIAQIVFHHTGQVRSSYEKISGKYQTGDNLPALIKNWRPEQMLPQAYKDRRRQPLPLILLASRHLTTYF